MSNEERITRLESLARGDAAWSGVVNDRLDRLEKAVLTNSDMLHSLAQRVDRLEAQVAIVLKTIGVMNETAAELVARSNAVGPRGGQ